VVGAKARAVGDERPVVAGFKTLFRSEYRPAVRNSFAAGVLANKARKTAKKLAMPLVPAAQKSLTKWLAMVAENDFHDLPSIIAADAVFRSPVGLKPYPGRELVCLMLSTAAGIFEDFKYHRKFLNDENAALEFSAHIGAVELRQSTSSASMRRANSSRSRSWCARWRAPRRSVMRWVRPSGRK
jgi:hypothetical protein